MKEIITTEAEHKAALALISEWMNSNPQAGSTKGAMLVLLAQAVEDYESKEFPISGATWTFNPNPVVKI
jgi:antitoxin component HigA of HigAB toxin-antitoxin module